MRRALIRGMRNKATPSAGKAKADKARGETAMRFVKLLRLAHKAGDEAKVQSTIKNATKAGVSKTVVDNALNRMLNRGQMEEVLYEGTLPGGVCVLVEALTDNLCPGGDSSFAWCQIRETD